MEFISIMTNVKAQNKVVFYLLWNISIFLNTNFYFIHFYQQNDNQQNQAEPSWYLSAIPSRTLVRIEIIRNEQSFLKFDLTFILIDSNKSVSNLSTYENLETSMNKYGDESRYGIKKPKILCIFQFRAYKQTFLLIH